VGEEHLRGTITYGQGAIADSSSCKKKHHKKKHSLKRKRKKCRKKPGKRH
jgi:hypothetical protein